MSWSFPVGRLFGSQLRVHATFLLLLFWIGAAAYAEAGPEAAALNVAFILILFGCVVAHEFGHALMARRYGIRTPDITLLPIGGLARLEKMPEDPGQEIAVALAGPAVNIVIWALLVGVAGVGMGMEELAQIEDIGTGFWARVAAVNLFLALFNLLPAFPMDGGRVFRAVLSIFMDRVRATRMAARGGQVLAFVFAFLGLTSGNIILLLIAFFVFIAAGAESNDVAMRDLARRFMARETMITHFEYLAPHDTLETAARALITTTQHEFPVLDADRRLLGMLTRNALFAAMSEGSGGHVRDIMVSDVPQARLTTGLEEVFEALHGPGVPAVAVTDAEGRILGYITRENIGEMMVVNGRRGG